LRIKDSQAISTINRNVFYDGTIKQEIILISNSNENLEGANPNRLKGEREPEVRSSLSGEPLEITHKRFVSK